MKHTFNQQKAKQSHWQDEAGENIPYNRTTKYERKAERVLASLGKGAIDLNAKLSAFKDKVANEAQGLYDAYMQEKNGKIGKNKGNVTLFNFDRSLKVQVDVTERITFDDLAIQNVQNKLMSFIDEAVSSEKDFIKSIVQSAFETSRGKLDVKKVLSLKKHADRIKNPTYHEAMKELDAAIRRPKSKTYFRVSVRNEQGGYDDVQLNFAAL